MGQTRAVICGYYGQGNGGDEALLMSLLQMLPSQVKPIVLSANPTQTSNRYQVETCPRTSTFSILAALRRSDAFIWGGGSLMQDVTSWKSPLYYAGLMSLAQQLGLRTIAWAQGIGPLKGKFNRILTRKVLQGCTAVSVRDRASAQLIADWQIQGIIAPDPVWALEGETITGIWDLPAPRVAVTLRPHPQLTPQRLANLTQALQQFQQATNACILLIPFQLSQDSAIAQSIASQLLGSKQIISLEEPGKLKSVFKGVEMVIGMRLHSLIMAAAEACRCFALSYDPKVSLLM
ncbi:MAG: polysaccharide pyruvyl transferase CsaB, partial [Okeania sp. SIO2D1]|nr:polysaccharide pyruvyl transferase CsaB [Okeania sp. SIO2D1]